MLTLHSGSTCVSLRSTYLNSVKLSPMPYLLSLLRPDSCSTRTKPLPVTREASTGGYFLLLMEYIAINIKTRAHLSSRSSAIAPRCRLVFRFIGIGLCIAAATASAARSAQNHIYNSIRSGVWRKADIHGLRHGPHLFDAPALTRMLPPPSLSFLVHLLPPVPLPPVLCAFTQLGDSEGRQNRRHNSDRTNGRKSRRHSPFRRACLAALAPALLAVALFFLVIAAYLAIPATLVAHVHTARKNRKGTKNGRLGRATEQTA